MVDQNGGGYMAPTGQSQAAASAAGYGTNSNIPLLQTPQQQQQATKTRRRSSMLVGRLFVDALSELRQAKEADRHTDGASTRQREGAHPHA